MHHLAHLSAGEKVLIHAAAGGVGQAAIQIAQLAGAEIFATASPGKWSVLKSLGVEHIMSSRSLEFADQIMAMTSGKGVDVVLNSLSGEFIPKSLSVLSQKGRFVEIGKRDLLSAVQVAETHPEVAYHQVDLVEISRQDPGLIQAMLTTLTAQFGRGMLKPLPSKTFPLQQSTDAFRYMQQARHIGKIVVTHPSVELTRGQLRSDGTYLITGGLGALGLLVAEWMTKQGAKHIALMSRRAADSTQIQQKLEQLSASGTEIVVIQTDVADPEQVKQALSQITSTLPPLRGIIHAAGLLSDAVLQQQQWESFAKVFAPKVQGTWNLHTLTKGDPLDFFVLFSSTAALLGSSGQANHSAANTFMDGLAHWRQAQGLPGLSINWGAWGQIGAAVEQQVIERLESKGIKSFSPPQGMEVLEALLQSHAPQVGVVSLDWSRYLQGRAGTTYLEDFTQLSESGKTTKQAQENRRPLSEVPLDQQQEYLVAYVRSAVAKVLGLRIPEMIELSCKLIDLGMDSLSSVELRNRIRTDLKLDVSIDQLMNNPSLSELLKLLNKKLVLSQIFLGNKESPTQHTKLENTSSKRKQAII